MQEEHVLIGFSDVYVDNDRPKIHALWVGYPEQSTIAVQICRRRSIIALRHAGVGWSGFLRARFMIYDGWFRKFDSQGPIEWRWSCSV